MRVHVIARWLAPVVTVCLLQLPASAGKGPAPYDLAIQVLWGDDSLGSETLRERVEWAVVRNLDDAACFASLHRFGVNDDVSLEHEADLLLRVVLSNLVVREDWEVSVTERTSPNTPQEETDDARTATVAFDIVYKLSLLPDDLELKRRKLRHTKTYRPREGENPREAVRGQVIDDLSRSAKSFVCKGSGKLPRDIARVRGVPD
jgi:hypothetical protein